MNDSQSRPEKLAKVQPVFAVEIEKAIHVVNDTASNGYRSFYYFRDCAGNDPTNINGWRKDWIEYQNARNMDAVVRSVALLKKNNQSGVLRRALSHHLERIVEARDSLAHQHHAEGQKRLFSLSRHLDMAAWILEVEFEMPRVLSKKRIDILRNAIASLVDCLNNRKALRIIVKSANILNRMPTPFQNQGRGELREVHTENAPLGTISAQKENRGMCKSATPEALTAKKAWPWKAETKPLNEVANHLAPLVGRSIRTVKEWSSKYGWRGSAQRPDNRAVAVEKDLLIRTLKEMGRLK